MPRLNLLSLWCNKPCTHFWEKSCRGTSMHNYLIRLENIICTRLFSSRNTKKCTHKQIQCGMYIFAKRHEACIYTQKPDYKWTWKIWLIIMGFYITTCNYNLHRQTNSENVCINKVEWIWWYPWRENGKSRSDIYLRCYTRCRKPIPFERCSTINVMDEIC